MSEFFDTLHSTATIRKASFQNELDEMAEMASIYDGELPAEYDRFFPVGTPRHDVNFIGLAWDDLAQSVARAPEIQVDPIGSSDLNFRKAQKLEKIVAGYFQNARPYDSAFLFQNAWNLVGLGRAVSVVVPDTGNKVPRLEARDPRNCYPGAKRRIGTIIDELSDVIFEHQMPRDEAVRQGLAREKDANGQYLKSDVTVYEYIDDTFWVLASADAIKRSKHSLGYVPVVYMQTFSPNKTGKSQFKSQVSLMVAVSRIITQKIAYLDRIIYPITWVKGLESEITLGPNSVTTLSEHGSIGQLTPPAQLQVDRDLATLERYQRILNRNTEARQGEVNGKGAYVGAKTLETLNDSVDNSVARFWDSIQAGYQKLAAVGLQMDEQMFGEAQKSISVIMKGQRNTESYTAKKDIGGRRDIRVAYGFGVGGSYQAFLENVQAFQAELVPKRRAVESMPGNNDANKVLRELELDKMDAIAFQNYAAMAEQGGIDMGLWGRYRKKMEDKGLSWHEAFAEYEEAFKEQAAQAQQQEMPATAMTQPPPQQGPEGGQAPLPGIPPSALMGV